MLLVSGRKFECAGALRFKVSGLADDIRPLCPFCLAVIENCRGSVTICSRHRVRKRQF